MDAGPAHAVGKTPGSGGSALSHLSSHLLFWTVAGTLLGLDLASKAWVFRTLGSTETRPIIPDVIHIRRSLNAGAVFGTFSGYTGLFIVASLFALAVVLYLFAHSTRNQRSLHIALALILAGALGNLYDRAFAQADVVTQREGGAVPIMLIGSVVSDPDEPEIQVGDWPDGAHPRSFRREDVIIRRQGVVRDFIKFVPAFPAWVPRLGGKDIWPWVFNVADAALVCGVGLLLIHIGLDRKTHRRRG